MVLKKKFTNLKRLTRIILVSLFLLTIIACLFYFSNKTSPTVIPEFSSSSELNDDLKSNQLSEKQNASLDQSSTPNDMVATVCKEFKSKYKNINEIKKQQVTNSRHQNIHKSIDGKIYRLRYFYKDGAEGERLQYLVYKENEQEEDILIETSPYKKGKQYQKIENALGEIIYFEEALTLGKDETPYLVYVNGQLTHYQANDVDCRF